MKVKKPAEKEFNAYPWFLQLGVLALIGYLLFANHKAHQDPSYQSIKPASMITTIEEPTPPFYVADKTISSMRLKPEDNITLRWSLYDAAGKVIQAEQTVTGPLQTLNLPEGLAYSLLQNRIPVSKPVVMLIPSAWQKSNKTTQEKITKNNLLTAFVTLISHNP